MAKLSLPSAYLGGANGTFNNPLPTLSPPPYPTELILEFKFDYLDGELTRDPGSMHELTRTGRLPFVSDDC